MCGARCLISIPGEFENLGENNAPRKKCCVRETGGEAAQGPGGQSLPMQETEGVRDQNTTWKLRGKNSGGGRDGEGLLY